MAVKTSNNGQFQLPAAPVIGTTITVSASANTYGSYAQMTASTGEADFITGITFVKTTLAGGVYVAFAIGTGAAASETVVGTVVFNQPSTTGSTMQITGYQPIFPWIPVANATRIAIKAADDIGSSGTYKVTLTLCKQADVVDAGIVEQANATQWLGGTIPAVNVTGVPIVDNKYLLGTVYSTPATAGIMDVNVKRWNGLTTVALPLTPMVAGRTLDCSAGGEAAIDWANSLVTVRYLYDSSSDKTVAFNLNSVTTDSIQLFDYVGVAGEPGLANGAALVGSAMTLAASQHVIVDSGTVTTVTNQLTAAQIATGVWTDTTAGDFTTALSVGKSIMNGVTLGTGLTINDITTKTGFTASPTAGSIVTASFGTCVAPETANTAKLAFTVANQVDSNVITKTGFSLLAGSFVTATFGTCDFTSTQKTSITTAATAATPTINATQAFNNTGTWTGNIVGTLSTLTTYTGNTPQTGDSFARIGAAGAGLTNIVLPSGGLANVTAWTVAITGNITGTVSGNATAASLTSNFNTLNGNMLQLELEMGTLNTSVAAVPGTITAQHGSGSYQTASTTGLATATDVTNAVTAIEAHGDSTWATAAGFAVPGDAMTLDMTQVVPMSNTAQTVGDALNAARAQGFGVWTITGTSLVMLGGDNATVVRTFTLTVAPGNDSRV